MLVLQTLHTLPLRCILPHAPVQVAALRGPSELQQFVAAVLVQRRVECGGDEERAELVT